MGVFMLGSDIGLW